jgi:pyruvoyl-dependent arginine decarboxylase (PvlArgDC)
MTYASDGLCLVAPIATESRKFLIAAGAPVALAHEAQNLGKGGEVVIHSNDYDEAYPIVRSLFKKILNTDFWQTKDITMKKVQEAAIQAGKSETASRIQIVEKAATITMPGPRPYCP